MVLLGLHLEKENTPPVPPLPHPMPHLTRVAAPCLAGALSLCWTLSGLGHLPQPSQLGGGVVVVGVCLRWGLLLSQSLGELGPREETAPSPSPLPSAWEALASAPGPSR